MSKALPSNWIFIRGLGRETAKWEKFIPLAKAEILKQQPTAQFEILDLAGNGTQKDNASFTHIADYCADLRTRSKFLQNKEAVNLVTISLASMVAMHWAHHHPQELGQVVLMNTSDKRLSKIFERMRPQNLRKAFQLFQRKGKHLATANEFSLFPDAKRENLFRQLVAAIRFGLPRHRPHVKFLMLSSLGDELVNPICSERIAHAWKIPHSIHPTGAHDLPIDQPEWCAMQIGKSLK